MASVVKTFHWTTDADSFTFFETGSTTDSDGTWQASGGDADAGCLECTEGGVNANARNSAGTMGWSRTLTFEDMGVPSGATVTGITSASIQSK